MHFCIINITLSKSKAASNVYDPFVFFTRVACHKDKHGGENLLKHKARMDKLIAEGERATLNHLNSPTRLPVGSMLEKKQAWWAGVWLVRRLSWVIVLDKFLHGLHAALADVPEVLLQRGLDGTLQGLILGYQHLRHEAKHFTFLIVHLFRHREPLY